MTTIVKQLEDMMDKIMLLFNKVADRINQIDDRVKTLEVSTEDAYKVCKSLHERIKTLEDTHEN